MDYPSKLSYLRTLGRVMSMAARRTPFALTAFVLINLLRPAVELLVFHQLRIALSILSNSGLMEAAFGAIMILGAVILARDLLACFADLIGIYFQGKVEGSAAELMNEKAARLELIDFETLDANERLELARAGIAGALSMLVYFMYPVIGFLSSAVVAGYVYTISPLLAVIVPLIFLPRIASYVIQGSRYYRLETKTIPTLREFRYLERCMVDREYFKETRTLGILEHLLQRYRSGIQLFNAKHWREALRLGGIDLGLSVLVLLGYGGSFVLVALLLAGGSIGVGEFAAVVYALTRLMLGSQSVMDLIGRSYRDSARAAHLIEFLLRGEGRPVGRGAGDAISGAITARGVTFAYPGADAASVTDIDLSIPRGTTLALVGANGAGKTTLAKLLLGLYVPTRGKVIRGNVDTREATRNGVRERTSAVFQNFQRYQMTLRENVILADVTSAEDAAALRQALAEGGVPRELWRSDDGLDLMLSREFGERDLSLGEWQRLAIARGLFRRHDTIVLDEPTASIDPLEESALYQRFIEVCAGRTAIIVTHRLGSARFADRILVMEHGRIVEEGTHDELIAAGGLYQRMFSAQAAWYERS